MPSEQERRNVARRPPNAPYTIDECMLALAVLARVITKRDEAATESLIFEVLEAVQDDRHDAALALVETAHRLAWTAPSPEKE